MANIYLVQSTKTQSYYSIKVQKPPHPWEFYILSEIHERRQQQEFPRCLHVYGFFQFLDTSYIVMDYNQNGTLLDVLNLYRTKQRSPCMPEPIALSFTLQLLEQIIALHRIQIVHNDLKLDNIMLGTRNSRLKKLPPLIMIDFGRSIDLSILGDTCVCKANWPPACLQSDYPLLNEQYHPVHVDYWQLATMAHLLLFGVPMKYTKNNKDHYRIQQTIKRYWHKPLWLAFFEFMLNPHEKDTLQELVQEFETEEQHIPSKLIDDFISLTAT